MKKFFIQFVVLVAVSLVGLLYYVDKLPGFQRTGVVQSQKSKLVVDEKTISIEIADDSGKRAKGLGDRPSLAEDGGMLFIFPKEDRYSFWMKGMQFPLDIIWIKDNKIVDITKQVPPPASQSDSNLPIYQPMEPVNSVLEVNGGFADKNGLKIGDTIEVK